MGEETTLFSFIADGSDVMDLLDQLDERLTSVEEQIASLVETSSELSAIEEAFAGLSDAIAQFTEMVGEATTAMDDVAVSAGQATSSLEELSTAGEGLTTIATDAEEAAAGLDTVSTSAAGAEESVAGFSSGGAIALALIASQVVSATGSLVNMGMRAEDSLNTVYSLAGTSQTQMKTYTSQLEQMSLDLGESLNQEAAGLYRVTSSGFSGAGAIQVLANATKDAKAGNVDLATTTSMLTSTLNSYGASANQANKYNDYLVEAVTQGNQTFQEFSSSIGMAAVTGHSVGISFDQVASAEATMTQSGMDAHRAVQDLDFMMRSMDISVDAVAGKAAKLGLSFDKTKYSSLDLLGQLKYLKDISGDNQAAFEKLVGGATGLAAAQILLTNGGKNYTTILDSMHRSAGATDEAFKRSQETITASMDKAGAALSVLGFKLVEAIGPHVIPIINTLSDGLARFSDFVTTHTQQAIPILVGLATVIGGTLVAAIGAFIVPMLVAAAPILAVVAAIGALAAGVTFLVLNWKSITSALSNNAAFQMLEAALHSIGSFLEATFLPIWNQLTQTIRTQLIPVWNDLLHSLAPLLPTFKEVAMGIGGVIGVAAILLISILGGVIRALAGFLSGVIQAFGGIVQVISGAIKVVSGIIAFFVDLTEGHFNKLSGDIGVIFDGIGTIITGAWNTFKGIFQAGIGVIEGFISGFKDTIVGIFQGLADILVNHSIIPNMINNIVNWIMQLPSRGMQGITSWVSSATSILGNLGTQAAIWASDMISGFVGSIENGIGQIGNAVGGIANKIKSILGFSLPTEGPLADADTYMEDFGNLLAQGLNDQVAKVQGASLKVAASISTVVPTAPTVAQLPQGPLGTGENGQVRTLLTQILAAIISLKQSAGNTSTTAINMNNNINASGMSDVQQLYSILQSMGGFNYQSITRGEYGL